MNNVVNRISDLKMHESFIQVDIFKGYIYLDKEGDVINSFFKNNEPPKFTVAGDGITFLNTDNVTDELKVTTNSIWGHYKSFDTLDQVSTSFSNNFNKVMSAVGFKQFTRIGWRTYFVKEYSTVDEVKEVMKKLSKIDGEITNVLFKKELPDGLKLNGSVLPVLRKEEGTYGILIDLDCFIRFDEPENVIAIKSILKNIRDFYKTDIPLNLIKDILE